MEVMQKAMAENQDAIEEVGVDQSTMQIINLEGWRPYFGLTPQRWKCGENAEESLKIFINIKHNK